MTATLRPQSDLAHWEQGQRPQSQAASEYQDSSRSTKRSPNRVKAKPAKPAVINSILESLDQLPPPSDIATGETTTPDTRSTRSSRSLPYSREGTIRSFTSRVRSDSSGYSIAEEASDDAVQYESPVIDAAASPTIRTSRNPSGLSGYFVPRTPSFTVASEQAFLRTPSVRSQGSPLSSTTKEKSSSAKNKLSAESWVKQNSMSREPEQTKEPKRRRKSLRRMNSQDTLRPPKTRIELVPPATDPPFASRAEQIIAKVSTPPPSTSKGRLYLTDSGSTEEQALPGSPAGIGEGSEVEESPEGSPQASSAQEVVDELRSSKRTSPQKNAIADSIPMRTSSLRLSHSRSPGPSKRREKKPKRNSESALQQESKVDSVMEPTSKTIPESSWADLGEEDETVKRIRELQERRRSRLMDFTSPPTVEEAPIQPGRSRAVVNVTSTPARRSEDYISELRPKLGSHRTSSEYPTKAHKVLGITDDLLASAMNGSRAPGRQSYIVDERMLSFRPTTSNSTPTPPLSLDYSYAEVVDALHGVQREIRSERPRTPEEPIAPPVQSPQLDLTPKRTPSTHSTPVRQPSTKSAVRKLEKRWTTHPDLPVDFDKKKNRRKSTSDARHTRTLSNDPEPPLPRRDSIEIAVTEYLQHSRLSRRVKHPLTGRVISFSEVGDRHGAAVFVCLGMGLTRYVAAFYDELATTLRLRLITIDRPGVGGSEPYPPGDRSGPLSWPDDVLAVSHHLGVTKFSMLAHSAGAIYALATALIVPHLIQGKIHLLAPWIPPSQLEAISHPTASAPPAAALPRSQQFLRVLPTSFLKAANSSFLTATSASLKPATKRKSSEGNRNVHRSETPPSRDKDRPATRDGGRLDNERRESMMLMDQFMPDLNPMENFPIPAEEEQQGTNSQHSSLVMSATATPMDPSFEYAARALNAAEHTEKGRKEEYTSRLTARTWELAVRDSNPATDLLVCLERHRDVGFRYTDVNRQVVITHGSEDKRVPLANVKWLAEQMNRRAQIPGAENGMPKSSGSVPQSREGWPADPNVQKGCEVRILDGEGHGLMASPLIMGDVLTEIAGYWSGKGRAGRREA